MGVLKKYNTTTASWEPTIAGTQGPTGPTGPIGPSGGPTGPSCFWTITTTLLINTYTQVLNTT